MVEPRLRMAIKLVACCALALGPGGCTMVPGSRLEECHKEAQSLRAESAQLKDLTLKLRAHNQDLAQRGLDDARRIKEMADSTERLERSVQAYQAERDEMAAAFDEFKRRLAASGDRNTSAWLQDLHEALPGSQLDEAAPSLTIPAKLVFEDGSAQWTKGAEAIVQRLATALDNQEPGTLEVKVVAEGPAPADVRLASSKENDPPPADLASQHAQLFRDQLAKCSKLGPARIQAGAPTPPAAPSAENSQSVPITRLVIRLAEPELAVTAVAKP
jgi:chemotaxis protein MotB